MIDSITMFASFRLSGEMLRNCLPPPKFDQAHCGHWGKKRLVSLLLPRRAICALGALE